MKTHEDPVAWVCLTRGKLQLARAAVRIARELARSEKGEEDPVYLALADIIYRIDGAAYFGVENPLSTILGVIGRNRSQSPSAYPILLENIRNLIEDTAHQCAQEWFKVLGLKAAAGDTSRWGRMDSRCGYGCEQDGCTSHDAKPKTPTVDGWGKDIYCDRHWPVGRNAGEADL